MTGMSVVVSDGEPFERDEIYKDFFFNHDPSKKRLLVMTYDTFLKDAEQSVVRDRSQKPTKEDKKRLKEAKDFKKSLAETYSAWKTKFRTRFDGRDQATREFLVERLKPADEEMGCRAKPPSDWTAEDEAVLARVLSLRHGMEEADKAIVVAKDAVEPPMIAEGLLKHLAKFRKKNPNTKTMLVCDEIHVLKNHQGKLHKLFHVAAKPFNRVIGMTATPVKNRLMEFFAIFRIIYPELFPKVTHFQRDYCVMKMQRIGGGRQVPVVVGHSKEQLEAFVQKVEPFYLSRRKHDVAKELPELITREIICTLSPEQEELYDLAELLLAEAEANPDDDNTQTLKTMTMIRQACNAPQLLADEEGKPFEGESSKIDQLVEILQENPDAKVLVFSAFERMISLIEARLKKEKINCTRITGKESSAKVRTEHVKTYQDPDSGVNVMLITSAGSESLNLQATEHLVFVDSPFSYGDYVQTIGRPQRIGSKHLTVLITHLVARRQNGEKTIDDHVIKILRGKKKLADSVSGEALKGGLQFTESDLVKEVMNLVLDAKRAEAAKAESAKAEAGKAAAAKAEAATADTARKDAATANAAKADAAKTEAVKADAARADAAKADAAQADAARKGAATANAARAEAAKADAARADAAKADAARKDAATATAARAEAAKAEAAKADAARADAAKAEAARAGAAKAEAAKAEAARTDAATANAARAEAAKAEAAKADAARADAANAATAKAEAAKAESARAEAGKAAAAKADAARADAAKAEAAKVPPARASAAAPSPTARAPGSKPEPDAKAEEEKQK